MLGSADGGDPSLVVSPQAPSRSAVRRKIRIPIRVDQDGSWCGADVATFTGLDDEREHLALIVGGWTGIPLVRLHSECLTGDVFGSARCDCGPQLREALALLQASGGIILYLRQEGRGIGLYNKLDAYRLQDSGLDTFRANRELNFEEDSRDYRPAAQMLEALGVPAIRLLTNNPDKVEQLRLSGVEIVECVPTGVYVNESNRRYLEAKAEIANHRITM